MGNSCRVDGATCRCHKEHRWLSGREICRKHLPREMLRHRKEFRQLVEEEEVDKASVCKAVAREFHPDGTDESIEDVEPSRKRPRTLV
jgi:hypothetical protein